MPIPMTPELYASFAAAENRKRRAKNEDTFPINQQAYLPETFEDEAQLNGMYNQMSNNWYDSQQPYGMNFRELAIRNSANDYENGLEAYRDLGPNNEFLPTDGTAYRVHPDGSVSSFFGTVAQPGEEGFMGDAKNALMPLAKTAGSYALPMLFSMLMRGGK